ncbi:C2H2 finger domain transcription factor crzA-like [Lecanosticta acicola]|uniref:C2H2 finger domain transcription factor crzA-like n=1 Tax=Lecanosticta acicola TaxID=111012 RepID=A0AAI8YUF9_9PEZI|nr:C2H2 finger domain transcription factor crzA-like [Lecanosticta acicola]
MATYAEYPAQAMASNDFTLYPYPEAWNQDETYLPTSRYADPSYLSATTFDSYPRQHSYAPLPEPFDFLGQQALDQCKQRLQAPRLADSASHSFEYPNPPALSNVSDSGASVHSTISSAMGSPPTQPQAHEWGHQHGAHMFPGIVQQTDGLFSNSSFDFETIPVTEKGCVDPSLIQPFSPTPYTGAQFPDVPAQNLPYPAISSPAPNHLSHSPRPFSAKPAGSASPYARQQSWQPYPQRQGSRRPSISSVHSRHSQNSLSSEDSNKGLCPIATCGRHVKDMKAHMLTHQNERPEKCPIPTCEYHTKGFARKYDKNRHTLTHYKGTMVCGFCPGSGSAAEKSFNRADVFKRHLTSVHGVEQTPPNARRKSPSGASKRPYHSSRDVSGMCSTCGKTFPSAQDFYEHLDDCVLRVVQQTDPSEAVNEKLLTEVSQDKDVQDTMEKHMLPTNLDYNAPTSFDEEEEEEAEDEDDVEDEDNNDGTYGSRRSKKARKTDAFNISNHGAITKTTKKGLTYSKNGVPLAGTTTGKGSKRRKNYPLSWGASADKMRMKKRVLCVYDGQRRLAKDDMMMDADYEVRIPLPGEDRAYVTDLDVQTLRRAEGFHHATDEEKGPWIQENDEELERSTH